MNAIAADAASLSGSKVVAERANGLSLQSNDFELFGLSEGFAQDPKSLESQWKRLQGETHPDKFAAQGAAAQRLSMQWSVRINEAYQRLKDPVQRGAYLCELRGQHIRAEDNTAMPHAFLMQQMEWRESLDEAGDNVPALLALWGNTSATQTQYLLDLAQALDVDNDIARAAECVRALMFIDNFSRSVRQRIDELDD